jgi:phage recombination protein Bet
MAKSSKQMNDQFNDVKPGVIEQSAHQRALQLPIFKRSAERSGMSEESFVDALVQTSLSALITWTQLDLERLLLAAEVNGLSPTGREIFLVPSGGVLEPATVVVGVDGWSRIINTHKQFAGMRFKESEELVDGVPSWTECTMYRWDRRVPTSVREYLVEVRGLSAGWITHPRRMLRHKAMVQCARLTFGLIGIYDADEAMSKAAALQQGAVGFEPDLNPTRVRAKSRKRFPKGVTELKQSLNNFC